MDTFKARELFRQSLKARRSCGNPGMQFDTTVNDWHTCSKTARINASNPCSEYMYLDDSACNLASLNLMQFRNRDGGVRRRGLQARHAKSSFWLRKSSSTTRLSHREDRDNSHEFRPLGFGYANLGALLMSRGLPTTAMRAGTYSAAITALMCGRRTRCRRASPSTAGPFEGYPINREPMLRVIASTAQRTASRTQDCPPNCSRQQANRGTSAAPRQSGTAIATGKSPCWHPPGPSAS